MMSNDLCAVIMAGGMGSRLRPLTDHIPKPLAPIGEESAVSTVLRMLSRSGVGSAVLTLMYKGEMIEKTLGDSAHGIALSYIKESEPLGTAGSVKNAEKYLLGSDMFIVASGDAVCDFDLADAIRYHKEKGALATLILSEADDPSEYGIVLGNFDAAGRGEIERFIEKPPAAQAYSNLVNTGIYILSGKVLELIPKQEKYDFARDLFPSLIGKGLFGYRADGYWCDIGDLSAYKRCLFDAAAKKIGTAPACRTVGERNIIGSGCKIAASAKLSDAVLHSSVTVCENSTVENAIVCENVLIEEDASVLADAVIGAGSMIGAGAVVSGAKLPEGSIVPPGARILEEQNKPLQFLRGTLSRLDKNDIPFVAAALKDELCGKKAGIMWEGERPAQADAFFNVLGAESAILGEGYADLAAFAARELGLALVIFIRKNEDLTFYGPDGILISHESERSIAGRFKKAEPERSKLLPTDYSSDLLAKYFEKLTECAKSRTLFSGVRISLPEHSWAHPTAHALRELGAIPRKDGEDGYHIELSENGDLISVSEYKGKSICSVGASHTAALLLLEYAAHGESIALPARAPKMLDHILSAVGAIPDRFPENDACSKSRRRDIKFWLYDSAGAAIKLISSLLSRNCPLSEEIKKLPEFVYVRSKVSVNDPAKLIHVLAAEDKSAGDGVRIEYPHGSLCFIPQSDGGADLFCDAETLEEADSMIDDISKRYELQKK